MTKHYDVFKKVVEEQIPCFLKKTDETGDVRWVIVVDDTSGLSPVSGYWMDSFETKQGAKQFCSIYGIVLVK